MKTYYAFDNTYGVGTYDVKTGHRIGDVRRFSAKKERDYFVSCDTNHREPINSNDKDVKAAGCLVIESPIAEAEAYALFLDEKDPEPCRCGKYTTRRVMDAIGECPECAGKRPL